MGKPIITDYSIIREQQVIHGGKLIFTGSESQPASFFTEFYKSMNVNYPKFHKMDNLCKLGFLASEVILAGKNLNRVYRRGDETGLILYNAASSIDTDRVHQQSINDRAAYFPSPSVFVYTLANIVIGEICIRNKIFGESSFFIEKEFDPLQMYGYVSELFTYGIVQCCITGWLQMDGNDYEGVLYLIEKSTSDKRGIAIFDPEKLNEIYTQRI